MTLVALAGLCYSQSKAALELDVTKIGLKPRSEVVKILGPPQSSGSDMDNYPWGFVGYAQDKSDQIDYTFTTKASSLKEALARVGLEETSSPKKGPLSYFWNSSTGLLICCGFELDNVGPVLRIQNSVGFKGYSGRGGPRPTPNTPTGSAQVRS
jgi:hypothetical protein